MPIQAVCRGAPHNSTLGSMNTASAPASAQTKSAYFGVWAVFLALVLYMDWSNARTYNMVVGLLAFPGAVFALLWALRGGKWGWGALAATIALLCAYLAWWFIEISDRYAADPATGLVRTIMVQFQIWTGITRVLMDRSQYLDAICQLYWLALMPLLQIAFLPTIARSLSRLMRRDALKFAR